MHCLLQTLKTALTIPIYLLSCFLLLSSGSSCLFFIAGENRIGGLRGFVEKIRAFRAQTIRKDRAFGRRVSTDPRHLDFQK